MKVCYCADKRVLPLLKMSADTVKKFNPGAEIVVVSKKVLPVPYRNLLLDTGDHILRRHDFDRVTEATYYKLFLPTLGFDRCLYLDCDTLCTGPLGELWEVDVPYIGLCHSHNTGISQARKLGVPLYGSAGLLFFNCEELRKIHFTQTLMRVLKNLNPPCHFYHDETLLNATYWDLFTFLPARFFKCKNRSYSAYRDEVLFENAVVRHYIGGQRDAQEHDYREIMSR